MKLEVGKFYKARHGSKVKIYEVINDYAIGCYFENKEWWAGKWYIDGCLYGSLSKSSTYDIVSEWQAPLDFDWDCLPKWADRWIAMDRSGVWYTYSDQPKNSNEYWDYKCYECCPINIFSWPKNFTGTWQESLFENPKYKKDAI